MNHEVNQIEKRKGEGRVRVGVTYQLISDLKFSPRNPRVHSRKQLRQIARSIETFDFIVPVLVDADLRVIAGHGRILACQQLGWREVPTIRLEHLTENQLLAFMIADNRLTENSIWDDDLLAQQLKELSELDLEFSVEVTGFDMGEIDVRIEALNFDANYGENADDAYSVATNAPAVSCAGDHWRLGNHHVLCGNALVEASFIMLLGEQKAAMVFTDPPYNLRIEGNVSGFGANHHPEFAMASGEMSAEEFTAFLSKVCAMLSRYGAVGSVQFYCMDRRHMVELHDAARGAQLELLNVCIWAKATAGMGSLYRSQHELIFVYRNGHGRHRNNVQLGSFGRNRSNLWTYPGAIGLRSSDEGNLVRLHPTVKPVALIADAIKDVSARGDTVLDPFLGSGSTLIAAERVGRKCLGMEIEPLYVDTIIRRWQACTSEDAIHASSGRSFNELEAEKEVQRG
jgi:DNA modification methylase